MRLLVVTPEFPPHAGGGIQKYYALMTAAWCAAGADVCVLVASPYSQFDGYDAGGLRVRFVPLDDVNRHVERLPHLAAAPLFRRWIAAGRAAADWVNRRGDHFDAIETTDFGLLFAPVLALDNRPPTVVKMHGSLGQISEHEPPAPTTELDFALARMVEAVVLGSAEELQACSPSCAAEWMERLRHPVRSIPPPLPLPDAPPRGETAFAGVAVGRIQSWKGPEVLCRAFEELGTLAPASFRIAWVGRDTATGPGGQSMSEYLSARYPDTWGTRIVPIGVRSAPEVAQLQASVGFAVAPSVWDTFNYSVAEAMGLGCVVAVSDGAGASYLVDNAANGYRFAALDHCALAAVLLEVSNLTAGRRRQLGDAARTAVERELNPAAVALASLHRFRDLAATGTRSAVPLSWVSEFLAPNATAGAAGGYLENVSIRELARHLKTRVARKIVG